MKCQQLILFGALINIIQAYLGYSEDINEDTTKIEGSENLSKN